MFCLYKNRLSLQSMRVRTIWIRTFEAIKYSWVTKFNKSNWSTFHVSNVNFRCRLSVMFVIQRPRNWYPMQVRLLTIIMIALSVSSEKEIIQLLLACCVVYFSSFWKKYRSRRQKMLFCLKKVLWRVWFECPKDLEVPLSPFFQKKVAVFWRV